MLAPVRTVAPAALLSPVEVKAAGAVPSDADNVYVGSLIAWATDLLEGLLGRAIMPQTWRVSLDDWPTCETRLPLGDLLSITSVKYRDTDNVEQTVSSSNYAGYSDSLGPYVEWIDSFTGSSLYDRADAITITWQAGYADAASVPGPIKMAVIIKVGSLYRQPRRDSALTVETIYGVRSQQFATGATADASTDAAIMALIGPYRRIAI